MDLTIGEGNAERWVFRRDPTVTRPWEDAVLSTETGIPYLAPDLQLLFKSKDHRSKDDDDATRVIPELNASQRDFLLAHLPAKHPWRELIK